ncbi:hypothetical protein [Anoxybacillus sp. J5B_2022]|uniref:hypothetical protein n=1 Tax=Anoxybacillus sp. J5B_2022 TaxID=3003246 RepID=UPI00228616B3|nr:hypothetical protein [Anoxybacillus sp. J5B_2022]MCZ0756182.1 hypothetical protein [Anoxybacillus sp. J5B_2022]
MQVHWPIARKVDVCFSVAAVTGVARDPHLVVKQLQRKKKHKKAEHIVKKQKWDKYV